MAFGEIFHAGYSGQSRAGKMAPSCHLARSGSQSHRTIWFILPARGASYIIIALYKSLIIIIIRPFSGTEIYRKFLFSRHKIRL